jgi:hypothetical protein
MSRQPLTRRLDRLEDAAFQRQAEAEAARIGALVDCPPETLLTRAQEIAHDIEHHGPERTIEVVAHANGVTAEELERMAARLAAD